MSDETLFREVDEEVRREELENIWNKYGSWFMALCLGIIVAVAGIKGWQYYQKTQAEAGGKAYFDAVEKLKTDKAANADEVFAKIVQNHAGFGSLARLQMAAAKAKSGKIADAVLAYDAIAADTSVDIPLRQLADIKAAYLLADTTGLEQLKKRLAPYSDAHSPWRNAAREILAIGAYRASDYPQAAQQLQDILADIQASPAARQRATMFLAILTPRLKAKGKSN